MLSVQQLQSTGEFHPKKKIPLPQSLSPLQATHLPTTAHIPVASRSPPLSLSFPHTILSSLSSQCWSCLSLLFDSFCRLSARLCISCCIANTPPPPRPHICLWTPFKEEWKRRKWMEAWIKQMKKGWFTQLAPSCRLRRLSEWLLL